MKRWIGIVVLLLGLPSLAMGGDCLAPLDLADGSIRHYWLKYQVMSRDTDWMNPSGKTGCLDTGVLKEEASGETSQGAFEQALKQSRQELRLGHVLRTVNKDPAARVYLCPGDGSKWNFNMLSSRTVDTIAGETDIPADLVISIFDRAFNESQCRRVPDVEIASLHDSIPPGLFAYLLQHLPDLQGKPFPPEVQPDLNLVPPLEMPQPEIANSTLPPLM